MPVGQAVRLGWDQKCRGDGRKKLSVQPKLQFFSSLARPFEPESVHSPFLHLISPFFSATASGIHTTSVHAMRRRQIQKLLHSCLCCFLLHCVSNWKLVVSAALASVASGGGGIPPHSRSGTAEEKYHQYGGEYPFIFDHALENTGLFRDHERSFSSAFAHSPWLAFRNSSGASFIQCRAASASTVATGFFTFPQYLT